jgi:hypothetical protein
MPALRQNRCLAPHPAGHTQPCSPNTPAPLFLFFPSFFLSSRRVLLEEEQQHDRHRHQRGRAARGGATVRSLSLLYPLVELVLLRLPMAPYAVSLLRTGLNKGSDSKDQGFVCGRELGRAKACPTSLAITQTPLLSARSTLQAYDFLTQGSCFVYDDENAPEVPHNDGAAGDGGGEADNAGGGDASEGGGGGSEEDERGDGSGGGGGPPARRLLKEAPDAAAGDGEGSDGREGRHGAAEESSDEGQQEAEEQQDEEQEMEEEQQEEAEQPEEEERQEEHAARDGDAPPDPRPRSYSAAILAALRLESSAAAHEAMKELKAKVMSHNTAVAAAFMADTAAQYSAAERDADAAWWHARQAERAAAAAAAAARRRLRAR